MRGLGILLGIVLMVQLGLVGFCVFMLNQDIEQGPAVLYAICLPINIGFGFMNAYLLFWGI